MARLRAALPGAAGAHVAGAGGAKRLHALYFDTPDLRLRTQGLTLRVRKQGGRYVQTLKSTPVGVGGVTVRGEWDAAVAGAAPDLSRLPQDAPALPDGIAAADLRPVFETDIRRTVRLATMPDGCIVEVAFDTGEIRLGDRTVPVAEVELELKGGAGAAAIYDLALALNAVAPLRVETQTKADRGFGLVHARRPRAAKAGRVALGRDDTVETALRRIVGHCVGHLVANEAAALVGDGPEPIHQMRVALRRLRSAQAVFKPLLPRDRHADLADEIRWLAGALGDARDWDVFLGDLMPPVQAAFPTDAAMAALATAARLCRDDGRARAREAIRSPRFTALLLRIGAWMEAVSRDADPAVLARPVAAWSDGPLAKRHKRARKLGRDFAEAPPEARHALRIALKKLRYATDFFRDLYPAKAVRRYADELAGLQAALGNLQDVATIGRLTATVPDLLGDRAPDGWRAGAGMVLGWHAHGLVAAEPKLVRDWNAFAAAKPFWSATD